MSHQVQACNTFIHCQSYSHLLKQHLLTPISYILTNISFQVTTLLVTVNGVCKSWFFVNHSAKTISGWTLVSVTFERLLVVYFPLKVKSICTRKIAFRTLAFISTLGTLVHLHYFWSYGPSYKEVNGTYVVTATCSVSHEYPELEFYMAHIRPWQDFLLRSAIPFSLLLLCNIMILCKMYLESRSRRNLTQSSNDSDTTMKSLTPMLLTVSFIYLFCISPMQIM